MTLSFPLGLTRCVPQENIIVNVLLTKREAKMTGYWPRSFSCMFVDLDSVSVHKHAKKERG